MIDYVAHGFLILFFVISAMRNISSEAKDLLIHMLKVDPTKRLSASEALIHPFITGQTQTDLKSKHLQEAQQVIRARIEARERREKRKASGTHA